jgi:hypothetical protein
MSHKANRHQRRSEEERFWLKVQRGQNHECWPWIGARNPNRYGKFKKSDGKCVDAHRHSLEMKLGRKLGKSEVARHKCDYRPCCNPDHLEPGSQQRNVMDTIERGRAKFFGRAVPPPADSMRAKDDPLYCPF